MNPIRMPPIGTTIGLGKMGFKLSPAQEKAMEAREKAKAKKAEASKPAPDRVSVIRDELLRIYKDSVKLYKKKNNGDSYEDDAQMFDRKMTHYVGMTLDDDILKGHSVSGEVKQLQVGGDSNVGIVLRWNADTGFARWRLEPTYNKFDTYDDVLEEAEKEIKGAKFFNDAEGLVIKKASEPAPVPKAEAPKATPPKKSTPVEILHKLGSVIEKLDPDTHIVVKRYNDSEREYKVKYDELSSPLKEELKSLAGSDIEEVHLIGESGCKLRMRIDTAGFYIYVETQDNWARQYVYRDIFETAGRVLKDSDYMKKKYRAK